MRPADDRQDDRQDDLKDDHRTASAGAGDAVPPTGPRKVPGAGGVVFDARGRVLVLVHANGDRIFPKGHIDGDETPLQAALREVQEESGIDASCPQPGRSWTTIYRNSRGEERQITWFACITEDPTPVLTEELFREAEFLPPGEALKQLTFSADRQLLSRVLAEGAPMNSPRDRPPTGSGAA